MRQMDTTSPSISVIICTYNRYESLAKTLQGLARLQVPSGLIWESIVVNNNSSDQTSKTVKTFMSREAGLPVRYVFEALAGLSHARNSGVRESRGKSSPSSMTMWFSPAIG